MNLARRLIAALSLPALAFLWLAGPGGAVPSAVAGDPPANPSPAGGMDDPAMGDPAMADPAMGDPAMGDPAMADPAMGDPAAPGAKPEPVRVTDAGNELARLWELLKNKKSDDGDILAAIDTVAAAYHNLAPDTPWGLDTTDADKTAFEEKKVAYWKSAEKAFLKAMELKAVKPNTRANARDEVNVKAAQTLGTTRVDVAEDIIKLLDNVIFKVKDYDPPTALYEESFKSIAILNDKKVGFPWLVKSFAKPNGNDNDRQPAKTRAMFDAVILFKQIKGADRLTFVKEQITNWVGVENGALINKDKNQQAEKKLWDVVKMSVIKGIQVFAGQPKDPKTGNLLATVKDLNEWYRDHDNPHDPAWVDAKKQ